MSIDDLFAEAERQLTICNACRYCEGYCAVFPALERRNIFDEGDMLQLANLCHDCRACFHACMYAPPHEFEINPPLALSQVRRASYDRYVPELPCWLTGRNAGLVSFVLAAIIISVLVAATMGVEVLWSGPGSSPYQVIPFTGLIIVTTLPCVWSLAMMARGALRYWSDVHGSVRDLFRPRELWKATLHAGRLRNLRGGGDDCYYEDDKPSPLRRRLHMAVFYGFMLCFASTVSAAAAEHLFGVPPPYSVLSAPVILGTVGGIGMAVGCAGLIVVKRRVDPSASDSAMSVKDYGLLVALETLAVTGLLTLAIRETPAFGVVLVLHIAAVVACFLAAPYSKFVHFQYRFLALVKDELEKRPTVRPSR